MAWRPSSASLVSRVAPIALSLAAGAAACDVWNDITGNGPSDESMQYLVDIEPDQIAGPTSFYVNVHAPPATWCLGLFASAASIVGPENAAGPRACVTLPIGESGANAYPLQLTASGGNPVLFGAIAPGPCGELLTADGGAETSSVDALATDVGASEGSPDGLGGPDVSRGSGSAGVPDGSADATVPAETSADAAAQADAPTEPTALTDLLHVFCGVGPFVAYGVWPPSAAIVVPESGPPSTPSSDAALADGLEGASLDGPDAGENGGSTGEDAPAEVDAVADGEGATDGPLDGSLE